MLRLTQTQRSAAALLLTAAFLMTGKLFIWKTDKPTTAQTDTPPTAELSVPPVTTAPPAQSETLPLTELTYDTDNTPIVPIEPHTDETPETTAADVAAFSSTTAPVTTAVGALTSASSSETLPVTTAAPETTAAPVPETTTVPAAAVDTDYFSDALFIGDSRTVGLAEYAPIDGATYFATVGLSTYKVDAVTSEVPGTKGQSFAQVLSAKQYGKIYIMLGINELGNDFNATMKHYRELIDRVKQAHPNAIVVLLGNLHVAYSRSSTDPVVNNSVINNFNDALYNMADGQKIHYLDVNPVFDDDNGCLKAEYTSDGTHPYAKYYLNWKEWLMNHTIPT